jgi:hypothetical protein
MRMIMEELDSEFVELVSDFLESSHRLREAAELCDEDPIKQDMIKGIVEPFQDAQRRSTTLRHLSETDYEKNRAFILSELKELTQINNEMALEIEKKLRPLSWN